MRCPRLSAVFALLLCLCVTHATPAQDAPFIGVVTDTELDIRSGAGRAYYVVGELKKGDIVRVEKVLFNKTWYQVRVPKGVHSYVSKAFVDAQGDGEKGKINTDKTEFKAASTNGPGESYRVQGTLSQGDTVKIIGEEGNFYRIESPDDAYVFIPAGTLRKATEDDLKKAKDPDPKTDDKDPKTDDGKTTEPVGPVPPVKPDDKEPKPDDKDPKPDDKDPKPDDKDPKPDDKDPKPDDKEPKTDDPEPIKIVPGTDGWPPVPDVKVNTPAKSEALRMLELKVLPYAALPVTQQPLDKIAKAYQKMKGTEGLSQIDKQIIDVRLRQIEGRQRRLDVINQAKQAGTDDKALTKVPDKKEDKPIPNRYDAVGLLQPSTVYDGSGSLPLLYRIVDPSSNYTLAYIAPSNEINIAAMLNKLVGVTGKTSYDQSVKLNFITIDRAVLLGAEAEKDKTDDKDADSSSDEEKPGEEKAGTESE